MELYVLDSLYRRSVVVDTFESCVWVERFNEVGDITLNVLSSLGNRNLLTPGTYLSMNKSKRVMKLDTVEDRIGSDGAKLLICTGSSIENIMDERPARDSILTGLTASPKWIITGLPAAIARQLFANIMVAGQLDIGDKLPFYTVGNSYPADNIAEPSGVVSLSLDPVNLLSALKTICQTYDLGFRITRNADTSQLFFNVFSGTDRTASQTTNPPVVFAYNLDNLNDSAYLTSTKLYRNIAYVFGADSSLKVYGLGIDPLTAGFYRRVLTVSASDLKYTDRMGAGSGGVPAYTVTVAQQNSVKSAQSLATTTQFQQESLTKLAKMQRLLAQDDVNINTVVTLVGTALTAGQISDINTAKTVSHSYDATETAAYNVVLTARGIQELAKNNNVTAFDGEIPQYGSYVYDEHYYLGDLVEVRNVDGVVNQVRVTEKIFSEDANGEKDYPTLSSRLVITPGVWGAWDANQNWADVSDSSFWGDLT